MPEDKASEYMLAELNFTSSAYAKSSLPLSLSIYTNKFTNQSLHKSIEDVGKLLRTFIHDSQLRIKFSSVIKKLFYFFLRTNKTEFEETNELTFC